MNQIEYMAVLCSDKNPIKIPEIKSKHKIACNTPEFRAACSHVHTGENNPFYGKYHSKETVGKMRKAKIGKNNPSWVDGQSSNYPSEFNNQLKHSIRERDNNTCQFCNKTKKENKRELGVHHIDYNRNNLNPQNLITLCLSCNSMVNTDREFWTSFFQRKIKKAS